MHSFFRNTHRRGKKRGDARRCCKDSSACPDACSCRRARQVISQALFRRPRSSRRRIVDMGSGRPRSCVIIAVCGRRRFCSGGGHRFGSCFRRRFVCRCFVCRCRHRRWCYVKRCWRKTLWGRCRRGWSNRGWRRLKCRFGRGCWRGRGCRLGRRCRFGRRC